MKRMNRILLSLAALWSALLSPFTGRWVWAGGTDTNFATGDAQTVKRWARDLWVEMPREIYWGKFFGTSMDSLIQEKRDLEGQPGDVLNFTLLRKLTGGGVADDATLEGQEELMNHYNDSVTLSQLRNAVRLQGKMSERRTAFNQRDSAKTVLKTWLAETIDDDIFTQFDSSPTIIVYGGAATSTANILATDLFTLTNVTRSVGKAKKASPKIWPVKVGNRAWYVVVVHTDVEYDLRESTQWQQFHRDADVRGSENKIFTDMLGTHAGCIVHAHEKIPTTTTWGAGSNVNGASNFFLGRQAGIFAWGSRPEWWEKEFDYGNKVGFAIGAIWDFAKAVFNAADHAFISIRTARTNT